MPGALYVLLAALLWSTAGAGIKLSSLNAWQLSGGRSFVAAIALYALLPKARRWPSLGAWGVSIAYAATVSLFVAATKYTTAANAIFLQDTAPIWVVLLSAWLLKEKPSRGALLALPVFGLGLALFFGDQLGAGERLGNVLALGSGVAFASCIVGLRARQQESETVLIFGNALAALLVLPFLAGGPVPRPSDFAIVVFLGVFQLALAYVLFSRGLKNTPAIEASLIMLVEPVLNPVWTFLSTGETPGPWAMAGGAVVLAGVVWLSLLTALDGRERAGAT